MVNRKTIDLGSRPGHGLPPKKMENEPEKRSLYILDGQIPEKNDENTKNILVEHKMAKFEKTR